MHRRTVLIIGEICIDTHLDIIDVNGPLVRLGGIFHSARACSALGIEYVLAYYAPDYLEDDINYFSCVLKTKGCYRIGTVNNAPNVMLINESREAGDQGYYNIIKDQALFTEIGNIKEVVDAVKPTDILIYPGRYNTQKVLNDLIGFNGRIHIDFHYDSEDILRITAAKITTIILSTSSSVFKNECNGKTKDLISYFEGHNAEYLLVKENRGGAYCYSFAENRFYESSAYYVPTMHSVGVGDVYNAVFISDLFENDVEKKMRLASLSAAKYAETMCYERFETNVQLVLKNIDEMITLEGVRLSWEERQSKNIYLAAPDFPDVNIDLLDKISDCLKYHNFVPRLPIRENGLIKESMTFEEELSIYRKDVKLIDICDLLIAVLLFNDPGTLVELGMFAQSGKPTIVFDPYSLCNNMFVKHTPAFMCKTIGEVIDATYQCLKRR